LVVVAVVVVVVVVVVVEVEVVVAVVVVVVVVVVVAAAFVSYLAMEVPRARSAVALPDSPSQGSECSNNYYYGY